MPNSGCPTYRKGAHAAALAEREHEGQLEPRPTRDEPVDANGYDDLLEKLSEKALRVLEEDLTDSDTRARQEAARCIIQARSKRPEPEKTTEAPLTGEERIAALQASLSAPDAELAEAMRRAGVARREEVGGGEE